MSKNYLLTFSNTNYTLNTDIIKEQAEKLYNFDDIFY
jgi:hypothetical protein